MREPTIATGQPIHCRDSAARCGCPTCPACGKTGRRSTTARRHHVRRLRSGDVQRRSRRRHLHPIGGRPLRQVPRSPRAASFDRRVALRAAERDDAGRTGSRRGESRGRSAHVYGSRRVRRRNRPAPQRAYGTDNSRPRVRAAGCRGDFLAPGASSREKEDEAGVEKYQCCIHPWMRAEVRIAEK